MPSPSPRRLPRWRTDAFLALAIGLNYASRGVLPVVLPAVKLDLHLSDASLGLLGSSFFWTYALASPFAGYLADRFSRRLIVLLSVAIWSVFTFATGAAPGWTMLLVLRIGFGLSESFYLPSATALQAEHHGPETRTFAMGLCKLAQNLGPVAGALLSGWLAERWGWRSSFAGIGFLGLLLALSSRWMLSEAPAKATQSWPKAKAKEALAYLARDGTFLMLVANEILSGAATWIFFFWMPVYLLETYGVNMAAAGFAGMAMQQLSSFGGTAVGTWASRRFSGMTVEFRQLLFGASTTLAAPCLLCFLFHPGFALVVTAVAIFSFLRSFGGVFELPILCDVVPPSYRSTAVGLLICGPNIAGAMAVLAAGVLKEAFGLTGSFAAMSGVSALAGLSLLLGYWKFIRRDLDRAAAWEKTALT